jgi:hypothetical protein
MQLLEQLGVALGLASLAGVNLYLTVLLAGAMVRYDILHLAQQYQHLEVFGHPIVLAVAGVLFVMEFFADKIPWVDSLWDSVHTVIRPVGGTLLGLQALGQMDPWMQVVAGLIACGAALTTHSAKAGTRLLINHSPEPVSNISMSLAEDAAVVGGAALTLMNPLIALAVFGTLLIVLWLAAPRIFRAIRTTLVLVWNKLQMAGLREPLGRTVDLPKQLDGDDLALLAAKGETSEADVAWTARCFTGKCKGFRGLRPNLKALIVARKDGRAFLLSGNTLADLPVSFDGVEMDSRFLSDNITLQSNGKLITLRFPRGQNEITETVLLRLRQSCSSSATESAKKEPEPVEAEILAPVPAV